MLQIQGKDTQAEIDRINEQILELTKPKVYGGKKGLIIKIEKEFVGDCVLLQQHGIKDPKNSTIMEFYRAIQIIEKQNRNGKPKRHSRSNSRSR